MTRPTSPNKKKKAKQFVDLDTAEARLCPPKKAPRNRCREKGRCQGGEGGRRPLRGKAYRKKEKGRPANSKAGRESAKDGGSGERLGRSTSSRIRGREIKRNKG